MEGIFWYFRSCSDYCSQVYSRMPLHSSDARFVLYFLFNLASNRDGSRENKCVQHPLGARGYVLRSFSSGSRSWLSLGPSALTTPESPGSGPSHNYVTGGREFLCFFRAFLIGLRSYPTLREGSPPTYNGVPRHFGYCLS